MIRLATVSTHANNHCITIREPTQRGTYKLLAIRQMLFSALARVDDSPKRALETDFGFLDRCSWPAADRVRVFIESCLENYPIEGRDELIARIRSGDNRHFRSGTFELFLHEYLRRQGYVLTPHPILANGAPSRPDFLVECPDGSKLYLEAASASARDGRDPAGEARIDATLQYLDNAAHPDFFVEIESMGYPSTQPSGRRLVGAVLEWLGTLNADIAIGLLERNDFDLLPSMLWRHEEWSLTITAIPCRPDARGRPRRLIGMRSGGANWIDEWTPIRGTIMDKGRKYGAVELPLVIAVNVNADRLDVIDEMQALFGQEQFIISRDNPDTEPRMERAANGAWIGATGPRLRRCSGAWLFHDVSPYTLGRRSHTLYVNPWSHNPVPTAFLTMHHAFVVEGRIHRVNGVGLGTALNLPEEWPE